MTRAPLAPPPRRPPPRTQRLQEVRAPPPQVRCRDPAIHNTFMYGDMSGVYAVLKEPGMVNALMETVHEEMVWTPEMGMAVSSGRHEGNYVPTFKNGKLVLVLLQFLFSLLE